MITAIEQQTSDLDWFFTDGQDVAFITSGGGMLPNSVSDLINQLKQLTLFFQNLPFVSEFVINLELSNILHSKINHQYLEYFVSMAKKGLYTFDKSVLGDFSDTSYHIVARPINPIKLHRLPIDVQHVLAKVRYPLKLENSIDVRLIT